ncbi:MAG: hypothetical protein WB523_14855 [Candidatus Sulfotelmatobacter sp.]
MKSTQAWGWLAAGVLALGLNGVYQDGGAAWANRAVRQVMARINEPTEGVLALASGHADWFVAKSRQVVARNQAASCHLAATVARLEAMSARQEARFARMGANRARVDVQVERMRITSAFDPVDCPRLRVSIPNVRISVPGVHVETVGLLNQ